MHITLYQEIYDDILNNIKNGVLAPGEKLSSENKIASQYGVSRITSKKALDMLAQQGYIIKKPGLGSFVRPNEAVLLSAPAAEAALQPPAAQPPLIGMVLKGVSEVSGNTLLHKAYYYAQQAGCRLFTVFSLDSQPQEDEAIRSLRAVGAQGIMVTPTSGASYGHEIVKSVIDGYPIVCMDSIVPGIPAFIVGTDDRSIISDLVDYLIGKGHTRIGYYSSPLTLSRGVMEKHDAFIEAMCRHNIPNFYQYICTDEEPAANYLFYEGKRGKDAENIRRYLNRHPDVTAVIACEYRMAVTIREVLEEDGKSCPGDLSIICFCEHGRPSVPKFFHHVYINEDEMARQAVTLLLEKIKNPLMEPVRINVETKFIECRSVRAL